MKIIIAGGRDFEEYGYLRKMCNIILAGLNEEESIEIVSGKASGADFYGNKYAVEKNYEVKYFPANWNKYGKSAGPIRNAEMAKYSIGGMLIAFWDGKSKGTKNMIEEAKKQNLKIHIINY